MSYLPVDPQSAVSLFMHGDPSGYKTGVGAYDRVGDWSWEYFGPNADAFLDPADSTPQPAPHLQVHTGWGTELDPEGVGLGGCGCGGKCGGCGGGHSHGVGQATSGGLLNTGLFASTDISQWSWMEWAALGVGVWGAANILGDVSKGARSVRKSFR
jgi:hypothetical protein